MYPVASAALTVAVLLLAACLSTVSSATAQDNSCTKVVRVGDTDWADNYPIPLSLRRNLVLLVKTKMIETGEYTLEPREVLDGIYTNTLRSAVAVAQKRLGQEQTGCLTMDLVRAYE